MKHGHPGSIMMFILGQPVSLEEDRFVEFKEVKGEHAVNAVLKVVDEYAVAFLNSGGGSILWGIRDADRTVAGVHLPYEQRDRLRRETLNKLHSIQPSLDPTCFQFELHIVVGKNVPLDTFVVELSIPAGEEDKPYYTAGNQVYIRLNGANKKLNGQEQTEWIRNRMKTLLSPGSIEEPKLKALVGRIRQVCTAHGLEPAHLSRFFRQRRAPFDIALDDLSNDHVLLSWLSESKIAWIADTFLIRRAWIDGEDERVHKEHLFDKRLNFFCSTVNHHLETSGWEETGAAPEAYFFRWGSGWRWRDKTSFDVAFLLAVPLARFNNERIIFRYVGDFTPYPWSYARAHVQLRAWAKWLLEKKNVICHCWELSRDLGDTLSDNEHFWGELLVRPGAVSRTRWCLDDYDFCAGDEERAHPGSVSALVDQFLRQSGHSL